MSKENLPVRHINPRYRAYGKARIDIAQRAQTRSDWDKLWKRPQYAFPFQWGEHWKQCIEYRVDDFAAEVGFLIDVLGLPVNAFNDQYAMFTSPKGDFYFAVVPTQADASSTPPGAIRIQFMVDDLFATVNDLRQRGILFDLEPQPVAMGSLQWVASFSTPHGMPFEVWGQVEQVEETAATPQELLETPVEAEPESSSEAEFFSNDQDIPGESDQAEGEQPIEPSPEVEVVPQIVNPIYTSPVAQQPARSAPDNRKSVERQPVKVQPGVVFKTGQEMLAHLQRKAPAANPAASQAPAFRPAPKPKPAAQPEEEHAVPLDDLEDEFVDNHYHAISLEPNRD